MSQGSPDTFPKLLQERALRAGDRAIGMRQKDRGIWRGYTWREEYEKVMYLSLGFQSLGLSPGDKVSIIGDNEPELFWAVYAIQAAGAVAVTLFPDANPEETRHIVNHSDSVFVVTNDQEQTDKMLGLKSELPCVRRVIWWDPKGMRNYGDPWLTSFDELMEEGKRYRQAHPSAFEDSVARGKGEDVCSIFYTSGTTGLPKGAMLTHRCMMASIRAINEAAPVKEGDDAFSYLPPAWFGEPLLGSGNHLLNGVRLNFAEEPETLIEDLREISPKAMIWGPRQWENMASMVQVKVRDADAIKRFFYNLFLPIGYKLADLRLAQKKISPLWKALGFLGYLLVFRPIQDSLGLLKTRYALCGGSLIGPDTVRFFRAIGVNLKVIYGTTEGGISYAHRDDDIRTGTVGRALPEVEARIDEDGQLWYRAPSVFAGYYKDPAATAKVLSDGWYVTGDAVRLDDDGHLIFIDRISELGELSGGRKYSPQYIEAQLRFGAYVKDAIAVGGKDRDYVAAIINIDFDSVGKWAEKKGVPYTTYLDLSQKSEVADLVLADIHRVNRTLPEHAQVKRFVVLHKEFDPDEGELTRTRKLKRTFLEKKYATLLEAIYDGREEVLLEVPFAYQDGTRGVVRTSVRVRAV